MGILEVFLIKLLFTQLTIGDQLQDEGHERTMPQFDPIMMKFLGSVADWVTVYVRCSRAVLGQKPLRWMRGGES